MTLVLADGVLYCVDTASIGSLWDKSREPPKKASFDLHRHIINVTVSCNPVAWTQKQGHSRFQAKYFSADGYVVARFEPSRPIDLANHARAKRGASLLFAHPTRLRPCRTTSSPWRDGMCVGCADRARVAGCSSFRGPGYPVRSPKSEILPPICSAVCGLNGRHFRNRLANWNIPRPLGGHPFRHLPRA